MSLWEEATSALTPALPQGEGEYSADSQQSSDSSGRIVPGSWAGVMVGRHGWRPMSAAPWLSPCHRPRGRFRAAAIYGFIHDFAGGLTASHQGMLPTTITWVLVSAHE